MDEPQKMEALKKAYAEIILNTAKEAAARVMVSERKALRFEHDLRYTKDESLRMLLRLKHMIDSKAAEAEITSLRQRRKIEELDGQLNEAEEVIVDLRAELRKAHDRLEEVKKSHMQQSNGSLKNEAVLYSGNTAHEKKLEITEPFRSTSQLGTCCNPSKEIALSASLDNLFVDDPNLASIIIGSKEPELYKNGCTHRIRAERNSPGEEIVPLRDVPDQDICKRDDLTIHRDESNLGKCAPSSIKAENIDKESLARSEVLSINSIAAIDQTVKLRRYPRTAVRYARSSPNLSRFSRCQSIKPTTEPEKVDFEENSNELEEKLMENNEKSACTLRRSLRKRKVKCWDDISTLFKKRAALSRCKNYSGNGNAKSGEHKIKTKCAAEMKKVKVPTLTSRTATKDTKADALSGHLEKDAIEDIELLDVPITVKPEVTTTKAPALSSCSLIIDADKTLKPDVILAESTGGAAASDGDKNRLLKYTFSRKRKKDLVTKSDDCSSSGKRSMTGKMGEKPSSLPEMEKSGLVDDPSNDSQKMVEVACQLISLSGKHGW